MKKNESSKKKRPYQKPAIIFEEKIELLATTCGSVSGEKAENLQENPLMPGNYCYTGNIHS